MSEAEDKLEQGETSRHWCPQQRVIIVSSSAAPVRAFQSQHDCSRHLLRSAIRYDLQIWGGLMGKCDTPTVHKGPKNKWISNEQLYSSEPTAIAGQIAAAVD